MRVGASAFDEFCLPRNFRNLLHFGRREEIFNLKEHRSSIKRRLAKAACECETAAMSAIAEELGASPTLFPYMLDVPRDSVSFLRLTRADYERASFLDARLLNPQISSHALPWAQVAAAIDAAGLTERCGFIFHIGHVGSTLLSRLIGAHPAAFSVREPMVLRTLAQLALAPEPPLVGCLKLLSRTFEPRQLAVIKATS